MVLSAVNFPNATAAENVEIGTQLTTLAVASSVAIWGVLPVTLANGRCFFCTRSESGQIATLSFAQSASGIININVRTTGTARSYITTAAGVVVGIPFFLGYSYDNSLASNKGNIYSGNIVSPPTLMALTTNTNGTGTTRGETANSVAWGNRMSAAGTYQSSLIGDLFLGQVYNRVLTPAEFRTLWTDFRPLDGCRAYTDFSKITGTVIPDLSGYGNHGVMNAAIPSGSILPIANRTEHNIAASHRLRI